MINNVVLVGRLTRDPELRYSSSNLPMIYFTVAVNRTFTDNSGQRQADFISCVAFRKQAENMARYLSKGSLIGITGRIQTRNYQGKDGNTVYTTEVVADNIQFLESKSSNTRNSDNGFNNMTFNNQAQQPQNNFSNNNFDNNRQANIMQDFIKDDSDFSDLGEDFPSNFDGDFSLGENPFIEDLE